MRRRRFFGAAASVAVFASLLNIALSASEKDYKKDENPSGIVKPNDPWPLIPREYKYLKNPLLRNDENLSLGERLYDINCSPCHGGNLDGKGHEAAGLFPPPPNLIGLVSIIKPPQSYIFWRIKEGGPGLPKEWRPWDSAMPVWKEELKDEEIWQIILYIYEAAGETPP